MALRRFAVEFSTLIPLAAIFLGLWLFVWVADEVVDNDTADLDRQLLLLLRDRADPTEPLGPPWLEELGRDVTALGGIGVLTLLTAAVFGYLWLLSRRRVALLLLAAVLSGQLLNTLLKLGFDRPRPDLVPHGMTVYSASFPSGHAMSAAIVYLTLGALLAGTQQLRRTKVYILSIMVLIALAVGVSRVYLGVHWPSDVLAGWAVGSVWALAWWLLLRWLRYRNAAHPLSDAISEQPGP